MKRLLILLAALIVLGFAPTTTVVPAATGTPPVTVWVTICEENVGAYKNIGFKVHNTGANPLTDCAIETWVGPATTDWITMITWTACQTLAAGSSTTLEIAGNSHEKLRVRAQSTVGTSTYCRPYGN